MRVTDLTEIGDRFLFLFSICLYDNIETNVLFNRRS